MKKLLLLIFAFAHYVAISCHGMPLVNYNYVVGPAGVTINASSNAATCGCGPYYLEVEMKCTNTLTGLMPSCAGIGWNTYPWYRSLLNIPGYGPPGWFDNCILEPYIPIFIPFSSLCPGQVYYFRARENVCGAGGGPPGAWTAINSFTVPGAPLPFTGSITSSTTTVCSGGSAVLTANPGGGCGTVAPGTLNTYDWLHIPGTNNPQTIVVTPTVSTTYTCIIGNGCGQSATLTAFIAVGGALPIAPTIVNPLCFGNFGTVILPAGYSLYAWSANTSSTNTATYLAGAYSVSVIISGCLSTGTFALVNPPQLTLTPTAAPSVICFNGISTLNANVSGGTAPYTYVWPPTSMTTSSFMVQPIASTSYFIGVQDANGCNATSIVSVSVLPPLQTNYTPTFDDICIGGSTIFTIIPYQGNGGPYAVTVQPGSLTGTIVTVSPAVTTTYTIITSDGCSPNDTNTVNVFVNLAPLPTYTTSALSGCEPLDIEFGSTTTGFTNCIWQFNGVPTNSCNINYTVPAGTYNAQLTVTGTNGCIGISPVITATAFPVPTAVFIANPSVTNMTNPSVSFQNMSTPGSYSWDFGDSIVSAYTWPDHLYGDTGTYVVSLIVINEFGCSDTAWGKVYISENLSVYVPNSFTPNGDGKNETFQPIVTGASYYDYWVFDRWGEMIFAGDSGMAWDGTYKGKRVPAASYVWKLVVTDDKKRQFKYNGHVTLVK